MKKLLIPLIITALINIPILSAIAAESEIEIGFLAPTTPVSPVDPEDPSVESGELGTGQPGPLSLDWVPRLGFGTANEISPQISEHVTTTQKPYVQVSDLRGTGEGWKLTASLRPFMQGAAESLKGSYITFETATTKTAAAAMTAPIPATGIMLTSDNEEINIATAGSTENQGMGTWVIRWFSGEDNYIKLVVPRSAATVGLHSTVITWTLHNAP